MNRSPLLKLLGYKPWRPRHMRVVARDLIGAAKQPAKDHRTHIRAALDWLCLAQDVHQNSPLPGGVAAGWSFEDGWLPPYPETTGYIIETFIAAAAYFGEPRLAQRARRMIDWELSLQAADGAFPGHFGEPGSHPVVFNQGQIMHGLIAGHVQLGREDCLESAARAARWLSAQQDDDGCYRKFEHNDIPHVYNTRAMWALAAVGVLANEPRFIAAARRNLDWALEQQTECGWFCANGFEPDRDPVTHTIAYAIRGFIETGVLLQDQRYVNAAEKAARGIMRKQRQDGSLAGTYANGWMASSRYSCITGVAQMALCWMRLAQITGAAEFRNAAANAVSYVKRTQRLSDPDPVIRGAIPGSVPIWGAYARFEFPNWAAKFFADALLMDVTNEVVPPVLDRAEAMPG